MYTHARARTTHEAEPLSQAGVSSDKVLLDGEAIQRSLTRIAHEIVEGNPDLDRVALVGIHTRGVPLAQRLRRLIAELTGREVSARLGRHHLLPRRRPGARGRGADPSRSRSCATRSSTSRSRAMTCVLVDDVLYTGRTIRAAIEALLRLRPPRAGPARLPRRPRPPRASDPSRLHRQEPADRARGARPGAARRDRRGRPGPADPAPEEECPWVICTSCGTTCARRIRRRRGT